MIDKDTAVTNCEQLPQRKILLELRFNVKHLIQEINDYSNGNVEIDYEEWARKNNITTCVSNN